ELDDLVKTLEEAPGVVVVDNPAKNEYPTAVEFDDRDEVFVGRKSFKRYFRIIYFYTFISFPK
ncbi:hypothetical protein ACTPD5_20935, partial [Clostridioides difficile]